MRLLSCSQGQIPSPQASGFDFIYAVVKTAILGAYMKAPSNCRPQLHMLVCTEGFHTSQNANIHHHGAIPAQ